MFRFYAIGPESLIELDPLFETPFSLSVFLSVSHSLSLQYFVRFTLSIFLSLSFSLYLPLLDLLFSSFAVLTTYFDRWERL